MSKHEKPVPELPGFETPVELSAADYIPSPGEIGNALWSAIPQIPSTVFQMVDAVSEMLPDFDFEAG